MVAIGKVEDSLAEELSLGAVVKLELVVRLEELERIFNGSERWVAYPLGLGWPSRQEVGRRTS